MFNLWLLLMFGSGMPLLYVVGVIWLSVVEVVDRHALARLCRRPARYGPRLPYLLLGAGRARGKGRGKQPRLRLRACGWSARTPIARGRRGDSSARAPRAQTCSRGRRPATARWGCGCTPTTSRRAGGWAARCPSARTAPTRCSRISRAGGGRGRRRTCCLRVYAACGEARVGRGCGEARHNLAPPPPVCSGVWDRVTQTNGLPLLCLLLLHVLFFVVLRRAALVVWALRGPALAALAPLPNPSPISLSLSHTHVRTPQQRLCVRHLRPPAGKAVRLPARGLRRRARRQRRRRRRRRRRRLF